MTRCRPGNTFLISRGFSSLNTTSGVCPWGRIAADFLDGNEIEGVQRAGHCGR